MAKKFLLPWNWFRGAFVIDVSAARRLVLVLFAVRRHHQDLAVGLGDVAELDEAVDFGDDRGLLRT
jgi:hypothetical protein